MSACDVDQAFSSFFNSGLGSRYIPDEATPLLQWTSGPSFGGDVFERTAGFLEAAALVNGPGLEPSQPANFTNLVSYASSKAAVDDSHSEDDDHSTQPAEKESPYLCGVSKRRFWALFWSPASVLCTCLILSSG